MRRAVDVATVVVRTGTSVVTCAMWQGERVGEREKALRDEVASLKAQLSQQTKTAQAQATAAMQSQAQASKRIRELTEACEQTAADLSEAQKGAAAMTRHDASVAADTVTRTVHIHASTRTRLSTHTHTYTYSFTHLLVHPRTYTHTHIHAHAHVLVHPRTWMHTLYEARHGVWTRGGPCRCECG